MNKTARALEDEFSSKVGQANINISMFRELEFGEHISRKQIAEIIDAFEMVIKHYDYLVEYHY